MKLFRAEQEKKLAQQKKEEEDRLRKEEADKQAKEAEEKRKRLEEAEKKRQVMMQAQKDKQAAAGHVTSGDGASRSGATVNHFIPAKKVSKSLVYFHQLQQIANVQDARREMCKTKEQLEEDKKISMSIRIKHLDVDNLGQEELLAKANDLWETIIRLETEKYDLEERRHRQDYDVRPLKLILL